MHEKREPAGAAVAGYINRPTRYTRTMSLMLSNDMAEKLEKLKEETGMSKGEIIRNFIADRINY